MLPVLPTSVIGSYPRPSWLKKAIRLYRLGKLEREQLEEAFNDAVTAVVREQEVAGIDIPSDGEQRRDEMVEYFAERIKGFKFYGPVRVWGNNFFNKPAVASRLEYLGPIVLNEYLFLRTVSTRPVVKVTITGPYTIADWSFNEYYSSKEELVGGLARIINAELRNLAEHGANFIQIDEPALTTHPKEMDWAVQLINKAAEGISAKIALHVCYSNYETLMPYIEEFTNISQFALEFANRGFRELDILKDFPKELGFGVIDVHSKRVESPQEVYAAIKKVMKYVPPERLYINPDCGLKLLPRRIAREKLENMSKGVLMVRRELARRGIERVPFKTFAQSL
uniref:Methionine synthase n=1 Tax=Fervidicoccus fontis TaxID=683846 RepID=A0A7J3ZIS8_9CREN